MSLTQTLSSTTPVQERISEIARAITSRKLGSPALLLLEMHKPLLGLAYNLAIFMEPLVFPLFGFERVQAYREVLQSPENLELLIAEIETLQMENS